MLVAPVLWSTAGVVTRHMERATPFEQVFWRSMFAFATIFLLLLFSRKNPWREAGRMGAPGLISGAMWAVMFTAFVLALSLTSTANTLVVMSVSPLLTAVAAWLFLREPVPLRTWLAASASAVGIAWMAAAGVSAQGGRDLAGMAVALLVPAAAAANVVTLRAVALRNPAAQVDLVPAVMLGAAISCAIGFFLSGTLQASARDVGLLLFLGVFQLGIPCALLVVASRTLQAPEVALLGLLEIVLGVLWTWLFAGETPATSTLLGGAVVLGALVLNELPRKAARMPPQASATRISG